MGAFAFNSTGIFVNPTDIGISGLNAARIAMQVTGHNIANVNTPGYSRQEAIQTTAEPAFTALGSLGRGSLVIGIDAVRDRFLEAQLAFESGILGKLQTSEGILAQLETIFNPIGGGAINESVNNFFGGFFDMASDPESLAQREELLSQARRLQNHSAGTITRLRGMVRNLNLQIQSVTEEANSILSEIASLNARVVGGTLSKRSVEDYRDKRNLLMRQLNELIGAESFETENGSTTVMSSTGVALVIQEQHATLSTIPNALDANRLDVVSTFNNSPTDITKLADRGSLDSLLEQRDLVITDLISRQFKFATILADAVNIQHRLGTDLAGNAGGDFFADPFNVGAMSMGANIDGITVVGDSATYEINYDVVNSSAASVTAIDISDSDQLTKHDYRISFTSAAGDFSVIDTSTERAVATGTLAGLTATIEGMDITFDALPADGDYFDLNFAGRTGLTGHNYRIEFGPGGDYDIFDVTTLSSIPVASGTLAAAGYIFFDGLAVSFDAVPAGGDFFTIGYEGLRVSDTLTATTIAASDSAPGDIEPGNNRNIMELARLGDGAIVELENHSFNAYQANEVSRIGTMKNDNKALLNAQEIFVQALETQRESVSGVSLDEEATAMLEFEQAFQANARYISSVDNLLRLLMDLITG